MKKLVLGVVLIFLVMTGRGQDFEGSIKMTMKIEGQKKAPDPAQQAQLKELQEKMNDPEFKSMLDANPQMKTQMEAMVKVLAMNDPSAMMPSAIITKVKGNQLKTILEGGLFDKLEMINNAEKKETYSINHGTKTYTLLPKPKIESQSKPKVTKTSETKKILNYNCTKYLVETTYGDGKTLSSNYWVTTELKGIDFKEIARKLMGNDPSFAFPDLPGAPMRIETVMPQMGTLTMETVEVKKGSVADSEFTIPSGYTEAKM